MCAKNEADANHKTNSDLDKVYQGIGDVIHLLDTPPLGESSWSVVFSGFLHQ
jgi:hypothetical protein